MVVFVELGLSLPSKKTTKKNVVKAGPPLTKLSGSAHDKRPDNFFPVCHSGGFTRHGSDSKPRNIDKQDKTNE